MQDSKIIGHAQNAAGGYNQAKANELTTLTGYETTINEYVPKNTIAEEIKYYYTDEYNIEGNLYPALFAIKDNKFYAIDIESEFNRIKR